MVTVFIYDPASSDILGLAPLVAEYDENGNLIAKYHHEGGGLLAMTRGKKSEMIKRSSLNAQRICGTDKRALTNFE